MVDTDSIAPPDPHAFYSAGRWLVPARYVVGWYDHDIIKVGSTYNGRRRYGSFLARGAELLDLRTFPTAQCIDAEMSLQDAIGARWGRAFTSREDAASILGGRGDGWTECYYVPTYEWSDLLTMAGDN